MTPGTVYAANTITQQKQTQHNTYYPTKVVIIIAKSYIVDFLCCSSEEEEEEKNMVQDRVKKSIGGLIFLAVMATAAIRLYAPQTSENNNLEESLLNEENADLIYQVIR